jgi:hypothetical protein
VIGAMSRVFWTFLVCGTTGSLLVLWATERLYASVEGISYQQVLPIGLFGALALTCVWVLPAHLFVTIVATLFFSFFRRLPLWFAIVVMIPICGLMVAYWDISDRSDTIQKSDFRKLLYWTLVVAPGEVLGATLVSRAAARSLKHASARGGE